MEPGYTSHHCILGTQQGSKIKYYMVSVVPPLINFYLENDYHLKLGDPDSFPKSFRSNEWQLLIFTALRNILPYMSYHERDSTSVIQNYLNYFVFLKKQNNKWLLLYN